jgi:cytochrome c oxidase cbb3-type subunit III
MDIWTVTAAMKRLASMSARMASALCCAAITACAQHESAAPSAAQDAAKDAAPPAIAYEANVPAGDRQPPGGELKNPLQGDAAAAKNGATLFSAMNCDGCHGGDASGWVAPSLSDGRWRYGGADGEVFSSIYYGRPKGMPAFGGAIGTTAVWNLVTYLKSLQPPATVPTESFEQ